MGLNDSNKKQDGAIITVLDNEKFDEVRLFWSHSKFYNFEKFGKYVKSQIEGRDLCNSVYLEELDIIDPTDHNEIFPKLLNKLRQIRENGCTYVAAISSGTPSMQACWILIAESDAFPLTLVRSDEPKWGVAPVRKVKLSAALPRIEKLKEENRQLKKKALDRLTLEKKYNQFYIGERKLDLSPMEFVYYRYFAERAKKGEGNLRFGISNVPNEFYESIVKLHRYHFPDAEDARKNLVEARSITCTAFRTNITRLNGKIGKILGKKNFSDYYKVEGEGAKFNKWYGLSLPGELITIK